MDKKISLEVSPEELKALYQMTLVVTVQGKDARIVVRLQETLERVAFENGLAAQANGKENAALPK